MKAPFIKKRKWTKEECDIIIKYYAEGESAECLKYLPKDRTQKQISRKAKRLGLSSLRWNVWTDEEIELLKFHWKNSNMKDLLSAFPNRNYNMLMLKAKSLGVKSDAQRKRIGSLDFLDTLNEKSAYWWGFIMADGHISHKGEVIVTVSAVDKLHIEKLANILQCKIYDKKSINYFNGKEFNACTLRIQDKSFGKKWLSILNINSPKTYTPPDLSVFLTKDLLLPFFIGLTDGDGCIWDNGKKNSIWLHLRIELHINWLSTLQLISDKLKEFYCIESKTKVSKRGYSRIDIGTKKDLKILGDYSDKVDSMKRKWSKLKKWT